MTDAKPAGHSLLSLVFPAPGARSSSTCKEENAGIVVVPTAKPLKMAPPRPDGLRQVVGSSLVNVGRAPCAWSDLGLAESVRSPTPCSR
jgi:hypothetical protein